MSNYQDEHRANLKTNADTAALIDDGKSNSEIALYRRLGEEVMRFAENENTTEANARKVAAKLIRGAKR